MSVARLRRVSVWRGTAMLLDDVSLDIDGHLVLMGPNGAGKTTLLRILSTHLFPSRGTVEVLGNVFGTMDLRTLRGRVEAVSSGVTRLFDRDATAGELVGAALHGAKRRVPLTDGDVAAADAALQAIGADLLRSRVVATLSTGEWQRVQIARALVTKPELLLLDEPFRGLDLPGREQLLLDLDSLLADPAGPTVVLVTHHVEEIPAGVQAAVLLQGGAVLAVGPTADVITSARVSEAFGMALEVTARDGRYHAVAAR